MRKFALIGKKLDYSFSRDFFGRFFTENHIDASYVNYETDDLQAWRNDPELLTYAGFNVTIPYKETIMPLLDEISDEARHIGAVNVVAIRNGKLIGHNTDAFGFRQSIKPFLTNKHERALILGTGGAAKAVAHVFTSIGIDVFYASRSEGGERKLTYEQLNEHVLNACKVVVNCTPLGTHPQVDDMPALPVEFLTPDHLVIDLIYNPAKTKLLTLAEQRGVAILNGASMLREQALKAWEIWNTPTA